MVAILGYTDAAISMWALVTVMGTTATVASIPSVTPKCTRYFPGTLLLLGSQLKTPETGEFPVAVVSIAPRDRQSKHVRTSGCEGVSLSVAFTANETVEATVTVSFPGMIKTGGILPGGPFTG